MSELAAQVAEASTKCVREQEGRSKEGSPKEEKCMLKRKCFEYMVLEQPLHRVEFYSMTHATVLRIP